MNGFGELNGKYKDFQFGHYGKNNHIELLTGSY